jgi:FkbM family methyltransferase
MAGTLGVLKEVAAKPNWARLAEWRRFLKNWPVRVLERFGLVRGDVTYRLRNGLSLTLQGGPRDSDALILWDIYVNRPYTRPPLSIRDGDVVVEVGAHVGCFTTWAAMQGPGVRVHSYEADPGNFSYLERNVRRNGLDRVRASHAAVGASDGETTLYLHGRGHGGNSLYREHAGEGRAVTVPAKRLDTVLKENRLERVDFLKLDCEGAEYDILGAASADTLARVRQIAMEHHRVPGRSVDEIESLLERSGFATKRFEGEPILYAWREGR